MTSEKIKIEDNFLDRKKFNNLKEFMTSEAGQGPRPLHWYFKDRYYTPYTHYVNPLSNNKAMDKLDVEDELDNFLFIHPFYEELQPKSPFMKELTPILELIQPLAIYRITANLLTRLPTIVENTPHTDIGPMSDEKLKQWTTSIFYINTNNGYTKFEDGTKVESVANRMLTFPTNMKHSGTACTDQKYRIIINFNYFDQSQELSELQSKGYTKIKLTP